MTRRRRVTETLYFALECKSTQRQQTAKQAPQQRSNVFSLRSRNKPNGEIGAHLESLAQTTLASFTIMETTPDQTRLSFRDWTYAIPNIGVAFLFGPISILQGIYATHFGVALTSIAMAVLIARLFDAVTDPIIGYFSDLYYEKRKSRKPFVVFGGLLLIFSSFFLYVPIIEKVDMVYFLFWSLFFYLAWTLFEIPHLAWGGELAPDSQGNNRIYSVRAICGAIGGLSFYVLPLLPIFATQDITPETLKWSVGVGAAILAPLLFISVRYTPAINDHARITPHQQERERGLPVFARLKLVTKNRPFLIFLAGFLFFGIGAGMALSLIYIYVDSYLGLGDKLALVFLISTLLNLLVLAGCYLFARLISKKIGWCVGAISVALGMLGLGLLTPQNAHWLWLLVIMVCINGGATFMSVIAPSILGDINDYAAREFKADSAASNFSIYALTGKTNIALGGAISLAIAGLFGFDPTSELNSEGGIFGLRIAIAFLPAIVVVGSIVPVVINPIFKRRHLERT